MKNEKPFAWVHKVDEALRTLDAIPLAGNGPPINLQEISANLGSRFGLPDLSIRSENGAWRKAHEMAKGMGAHPIVCGIKLLPLDGDILWIMSRKEVQRFTSFLLMRESDQEISSESLQDGFYRYLLLHAFDSLQQTEPFSQFSLQLAEGEAPSVTDGYCIDLELFIAEEKSCRGRAILSGAFLQSYRRHFGSLQQVFALMPFAKTIEIPISLRTGSAILSQKEWEGLDVGDVFLLDRGSYDPRHKEGIATLSLGATPLFHISIKADKIKLLDYALFYEEDMQNQQEMQPQKLIAPDEGRNMAIKEFPLNVTVELARLRMTVDQLTQLSPGNMLQLPVHPEQEVILSVNGQKVGRGEIVHLGEALGIRILELAE